MSRVAPPNLDEGPITLLRQAQPTAVPRPPTPYVTLVLYPPAIYLDYPREMV